MKKIFNKTSVVVCCAISSLLVGNTVLAVDPDQPPEGSVYIEDIVYGGTGCPQDSVGISIATNGLNFGVSFDQYIAGIGDGFSRADQRKSCDLRVNLKVPAGYAYTVVDLTYRGYAEMDRGIFASMSSTYHFQGEALEAGFVKNMRGPIEKDFTYTDSLDLESFVWSSCGATAPLVLQTRMKLKKARFTPPESGGTIGVDSVEGKLTHEYGLLWKKCEA
ncbi:DUF4360 domain-containing protein [Zooshikella marina]|uniref:DUF4360 domain-containing protein n=1 Tax=Zooshikella ganghwensis TaxID=202772 RepID=A0A4P9VQJ5_9GAMM|nr:DUF4360 domain-containing protein [Zooshikella ganghwensis]MBU2704860.1 DUF4360 domain-containing protein [Zooshikella ganghwensis]RDH45296.1 DUF4360 domain-containing protein [Zooshikella ganghwensis]